LDACINSCFRQRNPVSHVDCCLGWLSGDTIPSISAFPALPPPPSCQNLPDSPSGWSNLSARRTSEAAPHRAGARRAPAWPTQCETTFFLITGNGSFQLDSGMQCALLLVAILVVTQEIHDKLGSEPTHPTGCLPKPTSHSRVRSGSSPEPLRRGQQLPTRPANLIANTLLKNKA
jgi:hypothetical protein